MVFSLFINDWFFNKYREWTLLLPNPNKIRSNEVIAAAKKDKKFGEIKNVVNLFQWLLPGLITNVAFMREQIKDK